MMFAIQLDERTKKIILVLCALFILILLITGALYSITASYMKKESRKMDKYMYDLLKTRIVKTPSQFKKALFYHEQRSFFNNSKWAFRAAIILTLFCILLTFICFEGNYARFFSEAFKLIPIVKWQTVGEINESLKEIEGAMLLTGPDWLPASLIPTFISKNPNFGSPVLYFSTIYYVCMIACLFTQLKAVLGLIARMTRGIKMSTEVFEKDISKLDLGSISEYSETVNSPVPNQQNYEQKGSEQL